MIRTYALTRTPGHFELRRVFDRLPRSAQDAVGRTIPRGRAFDLATALRSDDPETLTSSERRTAAQMMHERGAAFMLSASPEHDRD